MTELRIQSHAVVAQLTASQPVIGSKGIELRSPDGSVLICIPAAMFPFLAHGDLACISLTVTRVAVEPDAPKSGLILPSAVQ